jgi:DNA-binding GntR family transcriptional regulator
MTIAFPDGANGNGRGNAGSMDVGSARQPLRVVVIDELRAAIIRGRFQPGERLYEEEIAAELGVSRNPIREALQALSLEGFITIEPRRGARVGIVDERRARELFELRTPLEGLVARLAAERRSADQLEELHAIVEAGTAAAAEGRLDELPGLNTRFHHVLADAADNDLLAQTLNRISHVVQWVYASRIRDRSANSWIEHAAIVAAIEASDGDRAAVVGQEHILAARDAYLAAP